MITAVYALMSKSEVTEVLTSFKSIVENETDKRFTIVRSGNGIEYCNAAFEKLLRTAGIRHKKQFDTLLNRTVLPNG